MQQKLMVLGNLPAAPGRIYSNCDTDVSGAVRRLRGWQHERATSRAHTPTICNCCRHHPRRHRIGSSPRSSLPQWQPSPLDNSPKISHKTFVYSSISALPGFCLGAMKNHFCETKLSYSDSEWGKSVPQDERIWRQKILSQRFSS